MDTASLTNRRLSLAYSSTACFNSASATSARPSAPPPPFDAASRKLLLNFASPASPVPLHQGKRGNGSPSYRGAVGRKGGREWAQPRVQGLRRLYAQGRGARSRRERAANKSVHAERGERVHAEKGERAGSRAGVRAHACTPKGASEGERGYVAFVSGCWLVRSAWDAGQLSSSQAAARTSTRMRDAVQTLAG